MILNKFRLTKSTWLRNQEIGTKTSNLKGALVSLKREITMKLKGNFIENQTNIRDQLGVIYINHP